MRFTIALPLLALGALSSFLAGVAHAEAPAAPLVRQLRSAKLATHPLADTRGRIPVLVDLTPFPDARALGLREVAPGVGAARLLPEDVEVFSDLFPELSVVTGPPKRVQLDISKEREGTGAEYFREIAEVAGEGVVVGVVDTGIDITHPAFRDEDGNTRIAWLITWGDPQGFHPELEEAYGCLDPDQSPCAIYSSVEIDAMIESDEIPTDVHDLVGHGTHVASIAAGNGLGGTGAVPRFVGIAPAATLVIVAPSERGGFGDDEMLRGTTFVFDRASDMEMPAVVNLSLGGDFGPHDGTSLLEKGLAGLVGDDKPGRAIVVAAGNSGGLYKIGDIEPAGVHTEVNLSPHAPATARVLLPGSTGGKVFVWVNFQPGDEVDVGLEGPDGTWVSPVEPGDEAGYDDDEGTTGAVINNLINDSTSLTKETNGAVVVWQGSWPKGSEFGITLAGSGHAQLWITATGEAGREGAYFAQATRSGTINTPASHPRLLGVGCTLNRHEWNPLGPLGTIGLEEFGEGPAVDDSLCYFSAGGPTPLGVHKPDIVAPGGFVAAAMGIDADPRTHEGSMFDGAGCPDNAECYVMDERYALATGTSMSSPHVAGAAALLFAREPNLTQAELTDVLQASARRLRGGASVPSLVGPGALNLVEALKVLKTKEPAATGMPDTNESWWLLSAPTARPDRSWPIWGVIELRRLEQQGDELVPVVASGLDESLFDLVVDNGIVHTPVVKVRHGLFRFAVAGREGSGGSTMRVEVLHDGVPIGEARELPIGVDAFAARSTPHVDGGCAIRSAGVSTGSVGGPSGLLVVAGLAVLRARRARRMPRTDRRA